MSLRIYTTGTATRLRAILLSLLLVLSAGLGVWPAPAQAISQSRVAAAAPGARSSQVVLILAPFISWDDVSAQKTPQLWSAAQNGAIANINARSRSGGPQGLLTERALTLGAGAPTLIDPAALDAYDRDERIGGDKVSTLAPAYLQSPLASNNIAYLGLPRNIKANAINDYDAVLGLLGSAIEDAGGAVAAIGNSDIQRGSTGLDRDRPAALIAMNREGYVCAGTVSGALLTSDALAPFSMRSDQKKLAQAMTATKSQIDEKSASKSLIVIDPGDLYRAQQALPDVASEVAARQWAAALKSLDNCYGQAREVWPQATIIVTSLATRDRALGTDSFGPLIVSPASSASSSAGLLISASTHRDGLVADTDLAPSILAMLGIAAPVQMLGSPLAADRASAQTTGSTPEALSRRIEVLTRMNRTAVSVESVRARIINAFVVATVLIILLGLVFVLFADRLFSPRFTWICKRLLYALILFVLALPVASWLMFFFYRWPATRSAVVAEFLATALLLWALFLLVAWKGDKRPPLIVATGLTTVVIIVDQILGAPASFASLFGYSPLAAARYYGMGNEAAAIMVGGIMVGVGLFVDQYSDARWMGAFKRYGIALLGLITMFAAAAPMLGANAGVAIWATMGFIVFWLLLNAKRFSWKTALIMVGAVVVVVGGFILADLLLPGGQTHLGRLVTDTAQGGFSQLWIMVTRKLATNLRVFAYTNWAYIFIAVIAYLIIVSVRPTGDFAVMLKGNAAFHRALISVLITGIIAFSTEDSGIVLPSLMVIYLGASIVWLMLGPVKGATKEERAAMRRAHLQRQIEALGEGSGERS
ncbi:MAG: hypothetical protein FWC54_01985 [Actinomycetia bacterium]|nr:hypothetical protein [Actinomycetes bacterium]